MKPNELRRAILDASNAEDLYDDGVDAILDAVIAAISALPFHQMHEPVVLQRHIYELLQSAKSNTKEQE